MATPLNGYVRPACESDIPTLLTIFLTSFRLHPLFSYLHAPLQSNPALAVDTIFFWERRFKLFILDPAIELVVFIVPREAYEANKLNNYVANGHTDNEAEIGKSWEMLHWAEGEGVLLEDTKSEEVLVGFATWAVRKGNLGTDLQIPQKDNIETMQSK
jgi:hypothetical protein